VNAHCPDTYSGKMRTMDELLTERTTPLAVLFSVSPSEFRPSTYLLLNATIIDASTGNKFTGYDVTVEFFNVTDDTTRSLGTNHSDSGIILKNNVFYPPDGLAYAYMAKILPAYQGSKVLQGIASNPVQLTVSENTTMLLEVTRDNSTLKHTLLGRLVYAGAGVGNRTIHVKINDTESLPSLQTNSSGYFGREFDFQPENNQNSTYIITATFDGDTPVNATAWAYTLDGQEFAACTTIQYGYKPSSNMTTLTVDPRVTQLMRLMRSPEGLQEEVRNSGGLNIRHEWSWWYPWYRMHFVFSYAGSDSLDLGIAIFPFANTLHLSPWFSQTVAGFVSSAVWKIVMGLATGEFFAIAVSSGGLMTFITALVSSFLLKSGSVISAWNSVYDLTSVFLGILAPTILSLVRNDLLELFQSLWEVLQDIKDFAEFGFGKLYTLISMGINISFLATMFNRLHDLGAV
jgi:hypothetical protein